MPPLPYIIVAILGLAVLMVVHEWGHYFAARRYGMRVTRFSIGFGPTLYKHRPKDSPTTFQIAIIPFLAYVQIAGMNPYEDVEDPKDPGSFENATLWARIVTIAAGPLANYFFASVLMFFGFVLGGNLVIDEDSMRVRVGEGPAAESGVKDGDRIVSVNGEGVREWDQLKHIVGSHAGQQIDVEVEREGQRLHVFPTPRAEGSYKGKIVVSPYSHVENVTVGEAAVLSLKEPPKVVYSLVTGIIKIIAGKEKPELAGPVGIVRETANAAQDGLHTYLKLLGAISAYLGGFNLLPFPALDGGRLLFLGFEAAARRRADAKIEAHVHAVGLLMFLTLIAVVTYTEIVPKH